MAGFFRHLTLGAKYFIAIYQVSTQYSLRNHIDKFHLFSACYVNRSTELITHCYYVLLTHEQTQAVLETNVVMQFPTHIDKDIYTANRII